MLDTERSLLRVVVLDVRARRRAARERLAAHDPVDAAALLARLVRRARRSIVAEREAALWAGIAIIDERRANSPWWQALAAAGAHSADPLQRALLADGPSVRGLLARGRLPDVAMRTPSGAIAQLQQSEWRWQRAAAAEGDSDQRQCEVMPLPRFVLDRVGELALRHGRLAPNAATVEALLRERRRPWAVLVGIAARRPTSDPIAQALVADDLAVARPAVRTALVENPSVPTAIRLGLMPAASAQSLRVLAAGAAHPVQRLAALLLAGEA